jgi:hypothetical protein
VDEESRSLLQKQQPQTVPLQDNYRGEALQNVKNPLFISTSATLVSQQGEIAVSLLYA